ncbi:hypothetical protein Py04_0869 [Pyrococcus sp. ST04]|nr:hypothetical protein Py04_0869 [Pyrococcus sp. ST04]
MLRDAYKKFKVTSGEEKIRAATLILKELTKLAGNEPYWDAVKENLGLKENEAKEVLLFLEEVGKLKIKRARNGRRLFVLTLKERKENPQTLDKWIKINR